MAKDKKDKFAETDVPAGFFSEDRFSAEDPPEQPPVVVEKVVTPVVPVMSFDRWFATTGRPVHHKAGMQAFLKTKGGAGRRTKDAWDAFFVTY